MIKPIILFDVDGVLVDSEPVLTVACIEGLRDFGIDAEPEDFKPFTGMGEDRFVGGVAEKHGVAYRTEMKERVYELYIRRVGEASIAYPWTLKTLAALHDEGYTMALASAADAVKVNANIDSAGVDRAMFGAIITGSDVVNKKPAPDIYLAAARALGVRPEECVVVEDAMAGVMAARAAGMRCFAVTTSFSREALRAAGAHEVIEDLAQLPERLRNPHDGL